MVVIYKIDSCYFKNKQKDHERIIKDKEDTFYYIMVLFVYDQLTSFSLFLTKFPINTGRVAKVSK